MHSASLVTDATECPGQSERRQVGRTPALFSLLYSGMDAGQILMGDGVVTNLSASGIGIRGNLPVTPGRNSPFLSTFLEWKSHCALPRAGSPGSKDLDLGWSWGP